MKPDRRPLRLSDERPRSDVLPTNAMIPPPHGFARTEDSIGNEKNITFWVEIVPFVTLAALMSALGQKQTCAVQKSMFALPPKADMCSATRDVCQGPKADSCTAATTIRSPRQTARVAS